MGLAAGPKSAPLSTVESELVDEDDDDSESSDNGLVDAEAAALCGKSACNRPRKDWVEAPTMSVPMPICPPVFSNDAVAFSFGNMKTL